MRTIESHGVFPAHRSWAIKIPLEFDEKGAITKATSDTSCRELAIGYFAGELCKNGTSKKAKAAQKLRIKKITKQAKIVFYGLGKAVVKDIEQNGVLNVLHMIEQKLGLPKTKCVEVRETKHKAGLCSRIMFVGHNKWYRSSHTASLWILLIRLALRSTTFRSDSWEKLKEVVSKYPIKNPGGSNTVKKDMYYVRVSFKNWLPLMMNVDKIFPTCVPWKVRFNSMKVHTYKKGPYTNSIGTEGIMAIAQNSSQHRGIPIFHKLMDKELKK